MAYRITADIRYLDGALAGITIPSGYSVTYEDRNAADRCHTWLHRVWREADFIRACGTGNRYEIVNIQRDR